MRDNLFTKIIKEHLISGKVVPFEEIQIKIDQTLTQDTTGTMVYLQLEAMNIEKIATEKSVAYIDHNMLQTGFENADDHEFIKSAAKKYGIIFSKPGNGICHQLHLERFSAPNKTLIGSDSHTPTCGAMGMVAIGAGGLDVAAGMAKGVYSIMMPEVLNVVLKGKLRKGVTSKDIILYILKVLTVKGGVNKVLEYSGDGIKNLSLTERATITNMGAELGATTSIFPADENTLDYLKRQGREEDFVFAFADDDAEYDDTLVIDLEKIEPLIAYPHSPDSVSEIPKEKIYVNQVAIGSCTNSSYVDLMQVVNILRDKKVNSDVDLVISPGSSNILQMLSENGGLAVLIKAGARILESGCGPCIGMGQAPKSKGVSLRTFNRNFKGRSGTKDASVYLVSPLVAVYSAIKGYIVSPEEFEDDLKIDLPEKFAVSNNYFIDILEEEKRKEVELVKGPNIGKFPLNTKLENTLIKKVVLKVGDNITTDDIVPSSADILKYRSNIEILSKYSFTSIVDYFYEKAKKYNGGIIVAGENYGQGSSREHAALVPLNLGIKAILAKSFARIHKANLINSGLLPLEFINKEDYDLFKEDIEISIVDLFSGLQSGIVLVNIAEKIVRMKLSVSDREKEILLSGGYLNYIK